MPPTPSLRLAALLFTPGTRSDRFVRVGATAAASPASGPDGIIVDLEDAVPATEKERVRDEVVAWFRQHGRVGAAPFVSAIRINSPRTDTGKRDLDAIAAARLAPDLVVLPKVESAEEVHEAAARLPATVRFLSLIETVLGVRHCEAIAAIPRTAALAFGGFDLSAETGGEPTWDALLWPRTKVVHACAAAGVAALDQPFIELDDAAGLDEECARVRALGYVGKLAIHPKQCAAIRAAFRPTGTQTERARRIVTAYEAAGGGVANIDGQMIDVPMYRSAQRILQRAGN
jgi:citrate lyase beta subunit